VYEYRQKYALYDVIGQGTAGTVYSSLDDPTLAYKHVDCRDVKDPEDETNGQFEARIIQRVCRDQPLHPNLLRLHRVDQLLAGQQVFLVMDRYDGGSLQDLLTNQVENTCRLDPYRIMHQALEALDYLHTRCDIAHSDIKPANIMVCTRTRQIKIIDFSCSHELEPPQNTFSSVLASGQRQCRVVRELEEFSTPMVRAPEHYLRLFHYEDLLDRSSTEAQDQSYRELRALRPRPSQRFPYVASSDVWSLAMTVYTMIIGKHIIVDDSKGHEPTVQMLIDLFGAPTAQHWPEAQAALRAKGLRWRPPPGWKEGDGPTLPLGYLKMQVRHQQLVAGGDLSEKQAIRLMNTIDCLYVILTQWNPLKRFTARRVLDQFFSQSPQGSDVDAALIAAFAVSSGAMPVVPAV
jgi:serine/threonine protein kinase